MSGWQYRLHRLNGDGTETPLETSVPLIGVSVETPVSGADMIEASVGYDVARLRGTDGRPLFEPWNTALYAIKDGLVRGSAIIVDVVDNGDKTLGLETVGFAGYPVGMPYDDDKYFIKVDSFDILRHIWQHLQGKVGGDLGVQMPSGKSGVLIGEEVREVEFTTGGGDSVSFEAGPFKLNFFSTDDLGRSIDDLAKETPFEYRVVSSFSGEDIVHKLVVGAPRLGRRITDLRFALGENIFEAPEIVEDGDLYASEIWVLGAGEGRAMKFSRALVPERTTGVRRVQVISDKSLASTAQTSRRAAQVARLHSSIETIESFTVRNHKHAPLGSYGPGDEIQILTNSEWYGRRDIWVRIISMTINTDDDTVDLSVIPANRA